MHSAKKKNLTKYLFCSFLENSDLRKIRVRNDKCSTFRNVWPDVSLTDKYSTDFCANHF